MTNGEHCTENIPKIFEPFPSKRYDVIVVDPPWDMKKIERKVRPNQIGFDYSTLSIDEIKSLNIQTISKDDCICFLWTTQKYLFDAKSILDYWGFKYLLLLTWNKLNGLCLFGFHWVSEFVLVGFKGKLNLYSKGSAIPTIFTESSWKKHSIKPNVFYSLIENLGEDRIDLFARRKRSGWDAWGDELTDIDESPLNILFERS